MEPGGRAEVLEQRQRGRELEHRVAVVVGVAGRVARAVADRHPQVAVPVHDRGGASHPDRPLALAGRRVHLEGREGTAALGCGHQPPVVVRAVPRVAAVADDHPSGVQRQGHPLQLGLGIGTGGIDPLVRQDGSGRHVEPEEIMPHGRSHQLVGHHEHLVARRVDHRCRGDPHRGGDVPAGQVAGRDRRRHRGRPQDRPVRGRQGHDGVAFGGHQDPAAQDQRFAEQLSAQLGRDPCPMGRRRRTCLRSRRPSHLGCRGRRASCRRSAPAGPGAGWRGRRGVRATVGRAPCTADPARRTDPSPQRRSDHGDPPRRPW